VSQKLPDGFNEEPDLVFGHQAVVDILCRAVPEALLYGKAAVRVWAEVDEEDGTARVRVTFHRETKETPR
jgi:hypothetical protein